MGLEVIMENLIAAVDQIVEIVPRRRKNVRSFHLKLLESLVLPFYQSVPNMKLRIDGGEKKVVNVEFDEGNDNNGGVSNKKKSKKCRIHKVKYMNSKICEMFDKDELGIDSDSGGENEYGDEDSETLTPSYFFPFLVNFPSFFTFFFRDLLTIPLPPFFLFKPETSIYHSHYLYHHPHSHHHYHNLKFF